MSNWRGARKEFLKDARVASFANWLADAICGTVAINYVADAGRCFNTLLEAKRAYKWPPKKLVVPLPTGPVILSRWSGLHENGLILRQLAAGFLGALKERPRNDEALAEWTQAILVWGGVCTKKGNGAWLNSMRGRLGSYMDRTLGMLASAQPLQNIDQLTETGSVHRIGDFSPISLLWREMRKVNAVMCSGIFAPTGYCALH